jgi:predicted DNA-binding transcriptional regulator YafY
MNPAPAAALRCLSLIALARSRPGIRLHDLAALAGMPAGAVARELAETAMLCGTPPYLPHHFVSVVFESGRVRVAFADHLARPAALTALEAYALEAALDAVDDDDPAAAGLREKIAALTAPRARSAWRRLTATKAPRSVAAGADSSEAALAKGRRGERVVEAIYRTPGRTAASPRRLGPLARFEREGVAYWAALELPTRRIKTYRADRFERARVSEERFTPPPDFDPTAFVRASNLTARRARVRGYRGAEHEIALHFADADAFAAHLLAEGGPRCEVVGPADLRAAVRALAERAAARHEAPET